MPSSKLFVGGLSWNTSDELLRSAFERFGKVVEAKVITDRETGRSRGFGFVTFKDADAAALAMTEMNGAELDGRSLRVNEAQERQGGRGRGFADGGGGRPPGRGGPGRGGPPNPRMGPGMGPGGMAPSDREGPGRSRDKRSRGGERDGDWDSDKGEGKPRHRGKGGRSRRGGGDDEDW